MFSEQGYTALPSEQSQELPTLHLVLREGHSSLCGLTFLAPTRDWAKNEWVPTSERWAFENMYSTCAACYAANDVRVSAWHQSVLDRANRVLDPSLS